MGGDYDGGGHRQARLSRAGDRPGGGDRGGCLDRHPRADPGDDRRPACAAAGTKPEPEGIDGPTGGRLSPRAMGVLARHASFRRIRSRNSLRRSAGPGGGGLGSRPIRVEHGFLGGARHPGRYSRTNASSTESTALRALGGTVVGFAVGGAAAARHRSPRRWRAVSIAAGGLVSTPAPALSARRVFTVSSWWSGRCRWRGLACCASRTWPSAAGEPGGRPPVRRGAGAVGDDLASVFRRAPQRTQAAVMRWAPALTRRMRARPRSHRLHPARRGAARLPGGAGHQAGVQGSGDAGDGLHAAPADCLLAGRVGRHPSTYGSTSTAARPTRVPRWCSATADLTGRLLRRGRRR